MSASFLRGICAALALSLAGMTQVRAAWRAEVATDPNRGVAIAISSPFEHSLPDGYLPLWVTIRNDSGATRTWDINCSGTAMLASNGSKQISNASLRVENGQTARLPVLMALNTSATGYYYQTNFVRVDGYAVPDSPTPLPGPNATGKGASTHTLGMSEALATPIWTSLTKLFADASQDLVGSPVDLGLLSGDWRSLVGLDTFWLTDADYAALEPARRAMIRDWVSRGGKLFVCAQAADPSLRASLGLLEFGDDADVGLGHVQVLLWDGKPLPLVTVESKTDGSPSPRTDVSFTEADWRITDEVGRIPLNAPFLITFIVLFAVVIGPLNLFWFAGAARRHRLFWTTPLISLGASMLLASFIMFQDGFGGSGQRVMLYLLLPDEKKAVVVQEQVARTGVLFSRQFKTTEDLVLTPLQAGSGGGSRSYEQNGRSYAGDWFASRSVQAHRAEAVVPSRAEIQLLNAAAAADGAPPFVTSSLPAEIKNIDYLDAAGHRWIGDDLRTGERITLRPANPDAGSPLPAGGSKGLDNDLNALHERPGYFIAVATEGPFFDTLPSIRWSKQRAIFAGPVSMAR